jgi:hypothetical protein
MAGKSHTNLETQFNRNAWLTLSFSVLILVYGVAVLAYRFSLPTDGWNANEGRAEGVTYFKNLMGTPSGLQPGDQVIAVEGYPADWRTLSPILKNTWQVDAIIDYTVIRDGQAIQVPVPLVRWHFGKWLLAMLYDPGDLAGQMAWFLLLFIAVFVFLRRPGNSSAGAFLFLNSAIASNDLISSTLPRVWPEWIDPIANVVSVKAGFVYLMVLLPFALIRFALFFPRPKPFLLRYPWLANAPLAIGLVLIVFTLGSPVGWFWFLLALFLTVVIILHNAFTMRDAVSQAQLLWGLGGLLFGFGLLTLMLLANTLLWIEFNEDTINLISFIATAGMGISLAVAITRYRLFDIDIIIRRTLAYGLLTLLLGVVYLGGVTILQNLFISASGQSSTLSVVLSTLAIAALFNPLRRRIQDFIDRRFFRQKYDAERALAAFAAAARNETDLEQLSRRLTGAIQETLQPEQVSLWLTPLRNPESN